MLLQRIDAAIIQASNCSVESLDFTDVIHNLPSRGFFCAALTAGRSKAGDSGKKARWEYWWGGGGVGKTKQSFHPFLPTRRPPPPALPKAPFAE